MGWAQTIDFLTSERSYLLGLDQQLNSRWVG
jgi:hypothetical protein